MEALKAIIFTAANHKETFPIMHIDVPRAYFHAEAQRLLPTLEKLGLVKKKMYRTWDAANNWERDWQEHQNLFRHEEHRVSSYVTWVTTSLSRGRQIGSQNSRIKLQVCTQSKRNSSFVGQRRGIKSLRLNRRLHWRKRQVVHQHVDVHVQDVGHQ